MSRMELKAVLGTLPKLTPEEVKSVRLALDFLSKSASFDDAPPKSSEPEMFYETLRRFLQERGIKFPPWSAFIRLDIHRRFQKEFPALESFMNEQFDQPRLIERQKLYWIFGELLLDWIKVRSLPVKLGVFVDNLGKIPELVFHAFPGYAEQGWLPCILKLGGRGSGS